MPDKIVYRSPKKDVRRTLIFYKDTLALGTDQIDLLSSFAEKGTIMGWDLYIGMVGNDQIAAGAFYFGAGMLYVGVADENRTGNNPEDNSYTTLDKEVLFEVPFMVGASMQDIKHLKSRSKRKFSKGDKLYAAFDGSAASANVSYMIYGVIYVGE